ncbi:MAG: respiratory chain complex I subunit 1 family protein [Nocardioidaceae bacterium]
MTATLPLSVIQLMQVLTVAVGAPGVTGVIAKVEARLQGRRGPRVLQPYFDLGKFFGKESLAPEGAGPFFLGAPLVALACYLTVPMLIPVLTSYALPLGFMGDILGAGFILAFASFVIAVAAAETGDAYAQLGSSRAKTFAAITEPVVLLVVFTVALVTTTDLPYVLGETVRSGPEQIVRPAHLLASAALFMVILFETGRIPVETHTGTIELGMIEEARSFEHSGAQMALLRWGSAVKQLVLFTIFLNVFVAPWGMAATARLDQVALAAVVLLAKACALGCVIAVIDDSFAKLRLFKITEFVSAAFLLAVLAVFTLYLGGG